MKFLTLSMWVLRFVAIPFVAGIGHAQVLPAPPNPASSAAAGTSGVAISTRVVATESPHISLVLARSAANAQVTVADVLAELQRASTDTRQAILANPDQVQQIANNLLLRRVLAAQTKRDDLTADPLLVASLNLARERVLSDARLAKIDKQNSPTEAALEAYARNVYAAKPASFEHPAQARVRHMLLSSKGSDALQKAKDMLAQLRAGASFEKLAKSHSLDAGSAARGGDLGFFAPGKMVKPFDAAVAKLQKPGELSEVVESEFGYHIIRLEERRDRGVQAFAEVRQQLLAQARRALVAEGRKRLGQELGKDFTFDNDALQALAKSSAAQ